MFKQSDFIGSREQSENIYENLHLLQLWLIVNVNSCRGRGGEVLASLQEEFSRTRLTQFMGGQLERESDLTEEQCICVTTEKHGDAVEVAEFISSCITKTKWLSTNEISQNNHEENFHRSVLPTLTDDFAKFSNHVCFEESNTFLNYSYTLPVHIIIPIGGDGTLNEVVNGLYTGLTKTLKFYELDESSEISKRLESGLTLHNANEMESKNGCRVLHDNSHMCNDTNARKSMWEHLLPKETLLKEEHDGNSKSKFCSDFLQKDLESTFLRYFLPPVLYMPAGTGADYAKMELCCKSASEVVQVVRGVQQYISRLIVKQMKSQKNSMIDQHRQLETKLKTNLPLVEEDVINKSCFHGYEVDIGKVTLLKNGRIRYFINECSLGMSVNVVERAERLKHNRFVNWLGGLIIFALSALISLILMKPKIIRVARLPVELSSTMLSTSITHEETLITENENSKFNSLNKASNLEQECQTCKAVDESNNNIINNNKVTNTILEEANLLTEKNGTKISSEAMRNKKLSQPFAQNGVSFEHFHTINALPTHLVSTEYALTIFASHIVRFTQDHLRVVEEHEVREHTSEKNTVNGFKKDEAFYVSLSEKAFASTEANRLVDIKHTTLQHSKEQKLSALLSSPRDVRAALDLPNTYCVNNNHGRRCNSELTKLINTHCCTDHEVCNLNNGSCSCKNEVCTAHCNGIRPSRWTDGRNLGNGTKVITSKQSREVKKNSVNSVDSIKWFYLPSSTLCFANGRWYGGGLQVTPHGNPTDGLLSCTNWVTTFWPFLLHVLSLYNGKHVEWNHTSTFDGARFIVDTVHWDVEVGENHYNVEEKSNKKRDCVTTRLEPQNSTNANKKRIHSSKSRYVPMSMEADGELIGELPALIEIAGVITFLVPREVQTFGTPIKGTTRACLMNRNSSVCEPSREQQYNNNKKTILRRWADKVCRQFKWNTAMRRETSEQSHHVHEHNMESYSPFNEEQEEEEELLQSNCINQSKNIRQNINCRLSKNYSKENRAMQIVIHDNKDHAKSEELVNLIDGCQSERIKTTSYGHYMLTKLSTRIKKIWNMWRWRSHQGVESDSENSKTTKATPSLKLNTAKKYENIPEQHHHHHHHQEDKRQQTSKINSNSFSKIIGQACDALWLRKRNQHQFPVLTDDGSSNYDDHKYKMHHKSAQDNIHVV